MKPSPPLFPWTGDHGDAGSERVPRDRIGDGSAGLFHEGDARNSRGDRKTVALRHLPGRQQLDHDPALRKCTVAEKVAGKQTLPRPLSIFA